MSNSTHKVEVLQIDELLPHPNADRLEIVKVFGYTVCVGKGNYSVGDLVAFVPPDSMVDPTNYPVFDWFQKEDDPTAKVRVKAKKLRGIVSYGCLVPAPHGSRVGDDVSAQLGVTHYDPPEPVTMGGDGASAPEGWHPRYDVDSLLRYSNALTPGEPVWVTEKIHGTNARYTFVDGKMHVGSHGQWVKPDGGSVWARILKQYSGIEGFCRDNPGVTLYGEIYGSVQELKYGAKPGELRFAAFDVLEGTEYWELPKQRLIWLSYAIPSVPLLNGPDDAGTHPYDLEAMRALADGKTTVFEAQGAHIREGIVIKPEHERRDLEVGRVCLKVVSAAYLEKAK